MTMPRLCWLSGFACTLLAGPPPARADQHVALISTASPEYTQRKFAGGEPRTETYVFLEGRFFDGATVDRSLQKMSFRRIAEIIAPELAKQNYLPARAIAQSDLLLVVHWGATIPRVTTNQMRGIETISLDNSLEKQLESEIKATLVADTPALEALLTTTGTEADRQIGHEQFERLADNLDLSSGLASNAQLLGYALELNRLGKRPFFSAEEGTLMSDLGNERYFVIVKAFDLHAPSEPGRKNPALWTLHVNIRSPGQNFLTALNLMGPAAAHYFGRTTDGVMTVRPKERQGQVTLGELVIIGEAK
jgi:hypothetical protein